MSLFKNCLLALLIAGTAYSQEVLVNPFRFGSAGTYSASIQSGEITMTGSTAYIAFTAVDSTHSWVYLHVGPASDGVNYAQGDFITVEWYNTGTSTDCDSVLLTRGSSSYDPIVRWYIVSDPGITSKVYTGSFASTNNDITISSVDTTKTWIYPTWRMASGSYDNDMCYTYFSDVTNVKMIRDNGTNTVNYAVWVVTYDSCTVQMRYSAAGSNSHSWSDLTGLSSTKTWAIVSLAVTSSSCYNRAFAAGVVNSTTAQINSYSYSASQNITAQFVTFTDQSTVLADSQIQLTGSELNESATIASHSTARTSIFLPGPLSYARSVVNNATSTHAYYWVFAELLSATSYDLTRNLQDGTQGAGPVVFIIEWNGVE